MVAGRVKAGGGIGRVGGGRGGGTVEPAWAEEADADVALNGEVVAPTSSA